MPYRVDDVSALARSLRRQIVSHHEASCRLPSHLTLLNMLARAAGHRNFQSYQADPAPTEPGPLPADGERLLRLVDARGRLTRWPVKRGVQRLLAWYLWSVLDSKKVYSEREITAILAARNTFDDPVILRRELINEGLFLRTPDGREYRKQPLRAPSEVVVVLRALRARSRS